jgi:gliding motility-associated-like protein
MVTADCDVEVTWTSPVANDNCGVVAITSSHNSGDSFQPGTTEVVYTATDNYGNISECRFIVVVRNNVLPIISGCPIDIHAEADISAKVAVTWTEPGVTFNCDDGEFTSNYQPGDEFIVGTTIVEYTAIDVSGNEEKCSFNVVVEFGAPVFEVIQVVTPNGDGINDDWTITNLQYFNENSVMVVDRWGSLIYRATGYNNESTVWKGVNSSGTLVPSGTYFYTIVVDWEGKHVEKRGFIEVVQ